MWEGNNYRSDVCRHDVRYCVDIIRQNLGFCPWLISGSISCVLVCLCYLVVGGDSIQYALGAHLGGIQCAGYVPYVIVYLDWLC